MLSFGFLYQQNGVVIVPVGNIGFAPAFFVNGLHTGDPEVFHRVFPVNIVVGFNGVHDSGKKIRRCYTRIRMVFYC